MVKESKFFRKQAEKAERMAQAVSDAEMSQRFLSMAKAYRSQANVLKAKEKPKAKKVGKKVILGATFSFGAWLIIVRTGGCHEQLSAYHFGRGPFI